MILFKTTTDETSSSLAKGTAKEKQITRNLRHQYPNANIIRTTKTRDGGKDIIVERGGDITYYEVKNWERPMSAYDVDQYITLHKKSSAELKIYNESGFTDRAEVVADNNGIELTSGSNYTPPTLQQQIISYGIWGYNNVKTRASGLRKAVNETFQRFTENPVARTIANGVSWLERRLIKIGAWIDQQLSIKHIVLLPALFAVGWLIVRWWNDEYTHRDLLRASIVTLLAVTGYYLLEKFVED